MYGNLAEVYIRSHGCTKSWQRLTEGPVGPWKLEWRSCRCMESWRKVPLTNGPTDVQKVCGSSYGPTESWQTLMECTADTQKVDGLSLGCTEGWQKLTVGPSVNFPCVRRIFRQLPSNFCVSERLSVNSSYVSGIFLQLPSTCCAPAGPSVNFR